MRARTIAGGVAGIVLLAACGAMAAEEDDSAFGENGFLTMPSTPNVIVVCHGFNCLHRDPVYLTEPYTRSTMMWVNDPGGTMQPYPCEEATETALPRGHVPHFLPGKSPLPGLDANLTDRFGTPYEPRLGGAATTLPEYIAKMKTMPRPAKVMTGGDELGN